METDVQDLERLGDRIAELSAHLDAATARLLDLIREFDARGGWGNGFASCAHWLSHRVGLDLGAARERVRVARALGTLPLLGRALARGELSYSKVRALTRVATPETEERLLGIGRAGTAEHVERIVRGWRRVDRKEEVRETAKRHESRGFHVYEDEDGMVVVRGRLEPEVGAVLMQALAAARETLYPRRDVSAETLSHRTVDESVPSILRPVIPPVELPALAQQQADALALVAETALHRGKDGAVRSGVAAERYQVVVHVDAAVLRKADAAGQSVLDGGTRVSAETSQRLACEATRVVMRHEAAGRITEIGARTRAIPPALRRALQARDRCCRFRGCTVRIVQGHHIRHWAHGGPTKLSNLVLLCRRHHRAVHEEGFSVARAHHGQLMFTRPDGRPLPEVPATAEIPRDVVHALREQNAANGIAIDSRTSTPGWLGEKLDVGYAIDVLHPRAQPPSEPA
jgi:hypothetical protein